MTSPTTSKILHAQLHLFDRQVVLAIQQLVADYDLKLTVSVKTGLEPRMKVLTCIAVEVHEPRGFGRCRMAPIADGSAASLHGFVTDHVEPGATIITDPKHPSSITLPTVGSSCTFGRLRGRQQCRAWPVPGLRRAVP